MGERLRPFLNSGIPKQFTCINSVRSLLQNTIFRVQGESYLPPVLFGQHEHKGILEADIADYPDAQIFFEPMRKNTAAPVILSTMYAAKHGINYVLVMPSDHIIQDRASFNNDVTAAKAELNKSDMPIAYFGIKPDKPFTEYGYIADKDGTIQFHEKPDIQMAAALIQNGALWNSGIFLLQTQRFLDDMKRVDEPLYSQCVAVFDEIISVGKYFEIPEEGFRPLPNIPFDKAYCEKANRGILLRAGFDWIDIGSAEMLEKARAS